MELSIFQAAILAAYYWFAATRIVYSLIHILRGPLMTSLFCGIVLGDVPTAIMIGAMIQPMFLAFTAAGGTIVWDECAAGMCGCTITILGGLDMSQALTIAVPISLLCAQLHTLRRIFNIYPVQKADQYAKTCNTKGITFMCLWWPVIMEFFVFAIPMFLALYFGAEAVGRIINNLPQWTTNALAITGKILPALGFAMTINVIGRPQFLPFFLGGFFLAQYSGIGGIPLALSGLFVAFLYYLILQATSQEDPAMDNGSREAIEADEQGRHLLTKRDVNNLVFRWQIMAEVPNSFARLQSLSFCAAFIPILKKLYGHDPEELSAALARHLTFFNTEGVWGSVVHGIVMAMEEQRALGAPVPTEAINGIKAGLMGPFAGIGDTINWSTMKPLLIMLVLPLAESGSFLAPIIYAVLLAGITIAENYFFVHIGYRMGTEAAVTILEGGMINKFISCASVLGMFMMGGLSASMVNVYTTVQIPTSGTPMSVQTDILDAVAPGLMTLATVLLVYKYLRSGHSMMKATFWLLGIGLVLGAIGILGDGGFLLQPLAAPAA
ncbi:MAG: PTS system mannose/fructose/sorbose family transporter subunit IID [Christensenellales bacterium]|nr:PTS system mannose/fructose/sorbose family transporter subunit IID [Clostridiales bacterium]